MHKLADLFRGHGARLGVLVIVAATALGCGGGGAHTGDETAPRAQRQDGEPPSQAPSRTAIVDAMHERIPAVSACSGSWTGQVVAAISFASDGRVTAATVTGDAPPAVLTCMEAAVRLATLPPFTQPVFRITYPFWIHR